MLERDPLSIVEPHPISELSSIITMPMCGYLMFFGFFGKKPKPFFPIIQPSRMFTLSLIIVFLIINFDAISLYISHLGYSHDLFIDCEGHIKDKKLDLAIKDIINAGAIVRNFGSYPEYI